MFDWPMEEEAKLEFTITVNWRREDGALVEFGIVRQSSDIGGENRRGSSLFRSRLAPDGYR